jgi:altronate dehydratase
MPPNWWIEFLECLEYANLEAKPKVQHTVEQHAEWLDFACSRVMAKVYNAIGSEKFNQIMKNGVGKLSDSDVAQIEDFKRRFGGE